MVAFHGELGAGKTTMIKGVCAGLGVAEVVKSPSFVIVTEYRGRVPVYHIDLYRLTDARALEGLGLDGYFGGDGICLVEWAERAGTLFGSDAIHVTIEVAGSGRRIAIAGLAPAEPVE